MKKQFSIKVYFLVVILLSWPFQIAYFFLGDKYKWLLLISMIMVGVSTFICGKYIFKDGFKNAGWNWGKPKHYVSVFALALFLWFLPSIIERYVGFYVAASDNELKTIISGFLFSAAITIIPAFGEEFGWRGYLLPRLLVAYKYRKALLIHGFITWIWHLPFLIIIGLETGNNIWFVPIVLIVSFIPAIMHAVVFAYIWSRTASLAVVTLYHVFFDEVRDTLQDTVGLGALGENWQMLVLTIMGILLLWKVTWRFKGIKILA